MFENTWESAYLKHSASIPCFFRMGPLHRLNSLDLNAMTYVDVGLCMFVPLAGTGEVLIGFELLHSKFRADLPAIHMWPVPEDALPAIGIVTRQGPPKSKAQSDGDSNFNNFVLLQEEFDPKRHFSKLKKATLHFTLHLVMLEACGGLFCVLFMALLYVEKSCWPYLLRTSWGMVSET